MENAVRAQTRRPASVRTALVVAPLCVATVPTAPAGIAEAAPVTAAVGQAVTPPVSSESEKLRAAHRGHPGGNQAATSHSASTVDSCAAPEAPQAARTPLTPKKG